MTTKVQTKQGHAYRVLDAVVSQEGEKFVLYGNNDMHAWLSLDDVHQTPTAVMKALGRSGVNIFTRKSREELMQSIEKHDVYASALVGCHPGWVAEGAYLHGTGTITLSKRRTPLKVVVALASDGRFGKRGTLNEWKAANAPFISGQPLVRMVYAYALVGYLMRYAPPDFQNPVVEIVGETGKGKTSLAVGAGSVCGGNPQSGTGYGLSWDRTNGTLDQLGRKFCDNLLILNENNLTGADAAAQAETMRTAVMKFTEPGERETMNSAGPPSYSRLALLSTSNMSIGELICGSGKSDAAIRTRVLTLVANREYGIFDTVPKGYADTSDAVRAMVHATQLFYGVCGRRFLAFLSDYQGIAITRLIERSFRWIRSSEIATQGFDERQLKTLALIRTAARLAKQAGAMPEEFGSIDDAMQRVLKSDGSATFPQPRTARSQVIDYLRMHRDQTFDVATLKKPMTKEEFERSAGCWIDNGERIVIPTTTFMSVAGYVRLLKCLSKVDDVDAEKGRLTKKVPSSVCHPSQNCRGYFIRVGREDI